MISNKMNVLLTKQLPELVNSYSYEDDNIHIGFTANKYYPSLNQTVQDVFSVMFAVEICLKNKHTGAEIKANRDLAWIPLETELGFKVGRSYRKVLGLYDRAKGWYLQKGDTVKADSISASEDYIDGNIPVLKSTMKLLPASGRHLNFLFRDGKILVTNNAKKIKCSAGAFLKVLTGKSYLELSDCLGYNPYILSTLEDEPSLHEAIAEVAPVFIRNYASMSDETLLKLIRRNILSPNFLTLDNASRQRLHRSISFTARAINTDLVEDVTLPDSTVIKAGTTLNRNLTTKIDESGITKLIISKDGKIFDLRKYPYAEKNLTPEELYTMINNFSCLLDGFNNFDEEYELSSRVTIPYEKKVQTLIKFKLVTIVQEILANCTASILQEDMCLLSIIRSINITDVKELITAIKDIEAKELQLADNTNPITIASRDAKVTTSMKGKASANMIRIQDSQRGFLSSIESPESQKIGFVHFKSVQAKIDESGFLRAPFIRVKNGVVQSEEPVYLSASETQYEYIAEWSEKFEGDIISAFYNGTVIEVPKEKVKYMRYSCFDDLSISCSCIPFANFNSPKRLTMGSNYNRQADPIVNPDRDVVSTGNNMFLPKMVFTAADLLEEFWESLPNKEQNIQKAKFLALPLQLTSTRITKGFRTYNFVVDPDDLNLAFSKTLSYQQADINNATYGFKLNSVPSFIYHGDDIVIHHSGMDIREYAIKYCADFGHMKVDPKVFRAGLSLGRQVTIGFTTFESYSIDDGIVIREGLVYGNKLTTVLQKDIVEECRTTEEYYEQFGLPNQSSTTESYMLPNGLPAVGTYLKPGDLVINKFRVSTTTGYSAVPVLKQHFLPNNIAGEVVSASLDPSGKVATVTLASISLMEQGDKFVGKYGNKGVITKVVPDHLMPYIQETGQVLDVCLNPLGVPSRMNIGQLCEAPLGMAMVKQRKIAVVTPFHPDSLKFVLEECEKAGVGPTVCIDGRTGLPLERPITVGVMNMLKLHHRVNKKMHAINLTSSINRITNQPLQGAKRNGGQTFGEMEMWCLQAAHAHAYLQELMSTQSDDLASQRVVKNAISNNPYNVTCKGNNANEKSLLMLVRTMGANMELDPKINKYNFVPLTDKVTRTFTDNPVDPIDSDSIYNDMYFGFLSSKVHLDAKDRWSYVNLGCEIVHPIWVMKSKIFNLIIVDIPDLFGVKAKPIPKNSLDKIIKGEHSIVFPEGQGGLPFLEKKEAATRGETGIAAVVKLFKTADINVAKEYYLNRIDCLIAKGKKEGKKYDYFTEQSWLDVIQQWEETGQSLSDYVISCLPIMPIAFRPYTAESNRVHPVNTHYVRIFNAIKAYKTSHSQEDHNLIYKKLEEFLGLISNTNTNKKTQTFEDMYFGKGSDNHGQLRENLLSKKIHWAGRSVITPNGNLFINEVGVPFLMCIEIFRLHLVALLKLDSPLTTIGFSLNPDELDNILDCIASDNYFKFCNILMLSSADESSKNLFYSVKVFLINFIEEEWVSFGRQPSLSKLSLRGFKVVVTEGKTLELNPLVCAAYNADFDGDQMHVEFPPTNEAQEDLKNKLDACNLVIDPTNGSNTLTHKQDILLGCYYATMLHDNVNDIRKDDRYKNLIYGRSVQNLQDLVDLGQINVHDLATVEVNGRNYISTVGRILFNSLLPDGFTDKPFENHLKLPVEGEEPFGLLPLIKPNNYYELKLDGILAKDGKPRDSIHYCSLNKYTADLYYREDEGISHEECLQTYQRILTFGFHFCDISGISIGLWDLQIDVDIDKYVKEADRRADIINNWFFSGFISKKGQKSMLIENYNKLTKFLKEDLIFKSLPRNNNLNIIVDSGSRGSIGQVMQIIGLVGISMKSTTEPLETPIKHGYAQGLSAAELYLASYGARIGINSTQNETANAGYATRKTVYMTEGLHIVEEDCGNTDTSLPLDLGELYEIQFNDVSVKSDFRNYFVGKHLASENDEVVGLILANYLPLSNVITDSCYEQLIKHHVKKLNIISDNGEEITVNLRYRLSDTFKNLLYLRDLDEDLFDKDGNLVLAKGHNLNKSDIDLIESLDLDSLKFKSMLTCRSKGGVCAHCYGKTVDFRTYPKVGDYIGIESAQAVGGPSAQLAMDLSHSGGTKGGNSSAISVLAALLSGSTPGKIVHAVSSNFNQIIKIRTLGDTAFIENNSIDDNNVIQVPVDNLLVKDGDYVEFGEQLTVGFVPINEIGVGDNLEVIRKRQLKLVDTYYTLFTKATIDILARHFEILAKVQTTLVAVLESDDPRIKPGNYYEISEVLDSLDDGYNIKYNFNITKQSQVIQYFSGPLARLAFERFDEGLCSQVIQKPKYTNNGIIGQVLSGMNVAPHYDEQGNLVLNKPKRLIQGDPNIKHIDNTVDIDDEITPEDLNVIPEIVSSIDISEDMLSDIGTDEHALEGLLDDITIESSETDKIESASFFD